MAMANRCSSRCAGKHVGELNDDLFDCAKGIVRSPTGASQKKGESHYVPGTGEEMVRKRTNFSPVPGTFTPILGRTHPQATAGI